MNVLFSFHFTFINCFGVGLSHKMFKFVIVTSENITNFSNGLKTFERHSRKVNN